MNDQGEGSRATSEHALQEACVVPGDSAGCMWLPKGDKRNNSFTWKTAVR